MAIVSASFWVLGLAFAVVVAPQLRIWTWGPTSLCFAVSILTALYGVWKRKDGKNEFIIVAAGSMLVGWLMIRASLSPVVELGQSDLLLTAMAVATFVSFRSARNSRAALGIFLWGIVTITAASLWVVYLQMRTPGYMLVFADNGSTKVSGFFAHYSYGASFLIVTSTLLASFALFSKNTKPVRLLFGILALLSAVAVYYTRSRGGILGLAGGGALLVSLTLVMARRHESRWFGLGILVLPFFLIGLGFAIYKGLITTNEVRGGQADLTSLADNSIRLYLYGIAFSCIALHPWLGGGARSFSWECFQFWDAQSMIQGRLKPEHVHNELLQTVTDYGLIGAFLLLAFVFSVVVFAAARILRKEEASPMKLVSDSGDAWRIGGLAGFLSIFLQSNFEGIFRIPPGAIMMALCLSAASMSRSSPNGRTVTDSFRASLVTLAAVISMGLLVFSGWKGTQASLLLWPVYFGKEKLGLEARSDLMTRAIQIWPLRSFYERRAGLHLESSGVQTSVALREEFANLALDDFKKASALNPFDPGSAMNTAEILSRMERDEEAEAEFHRAVELSGDMEPAFEANFQFAKHLYKRGLRQFQSGQRLASLDTLQLASIYVDKGLSLSGYYDKNDRLFGLSVHQDYGKILEQAGEYRLALDEYEKTLGMRHGGSSHFNIAWLYGNLAAEAWADGETRDALKLFMLAREELRRSRLLPAGVTPEKRAEYSKYLESTIKFLKGARYEPSENIDHWLK